MPVERVKKTWNQLVLAGNNPISISLILGCLGGLIWCSALQEPGDETSHDIVLSVE